MRHPCIVSVVIQAAVLAGAAASASDPTGIYAIIDRVVLEPETGDPERAQIWGAFALARGAREYAEPVRGYLYLEAAEDEQKICRREWTDLRKLAGSGKVVAFGNRWRQDVRVSPPTAKPEKPKRYPFGFGLTVIKPTRYTPVRQLMGLPAPSRPEPGKTVRPGRVELTARNAVIEGEDVLYFFEISDESGKKERSAAIRPGKKTTAWKPEMVVEPGKTYAWRVWVTHGKWTGTAAKSTFRGKVEA